MPLAAALVRRSKKHRRLSQVVDEHGRRTWEIGPLGDNGFRNAKRFTYRPSDDKLESIEEGTVTDPLNPTLTVYTLTDLSYDDRRNPELETISASGTTLSILQRTFEDSGRLECEARRMNPAAFGSLPGSACALGSPGSFGEDDHDHHHDAARWAAMALFMNAKRCGRRSRSPRAQKGRSPGKSGQRPAKTSANIVICRLITLCYYSQYE